MVVFYKHIRKKVEKYLALDCHDNSISSKCEHWGSVSIRCLHSIHATSLFTFPPPTLQISGTHFSHK